MKNIIQFYSKAKAYDNLASFFEACSNVEIDEYRDYDKAVAAIKEAIKHISKSTSPERDAKVSNLNYKREMIERFISLRDMAETNPG
jgi:intraflagellar transport protein 140